MTDKSLYGVADKATDSDAFEYAARAGFAISGVLHLLVGYIILRSRSVPAARPTSPARWRRLPARPAAP